MQSGRESEQEVVYLSSDIIISCGLQTITNSLWLPLPDQKQTFFELYNMNLAICNENNFLYIFLRNCHANAIVSCKVVINGSGLVFMPKRKGSNSREKTSHAVFILSKKYSSFSHASVPLIKVIILQANRLYIQRIIKVIIDIHIIFLITP